MSDLLLELEGLSRRFGAVKALDDVTARVPPGAIGLLGPNGAGKTTLLKILIGLLAPTSGAARILGRDVRRESLRIRQDLGFLPETDAFVLGLDAVRLVSLAGMIAGMPRRQALRRTHEVLSTLGLEEARYRKLDGYSTGMKQRLKLAQALVHDPPLLILDEPTDGLDPRGRADMLRTISGLVRSGGKSLILSSHLLRDVEELCDWILVLNEGKLVWSGRIDDLRSPRESRFRVSCLSGEARLREALAREGCELLDETRNGGLRICAPSGWDGARFFRIAGEAGAVIRELGPDRESLDQLFERLVRGG